MARDPAHFLTYQKTRAKEIIKRHNMVSQSFATACRLLGHHVTVEPKRLDQHDAMRVDLDITLRLKRVLADVTVRCSTSKSPDAVLEQANRDKEKKYKEKAREAGAAFVPLAFDAFGGASKEAEAFIQRMGREGVQRDSNVSVQQVIRTLWQEISVAIHRFNGQAMLRGVRGSGLRVAADGE